MGKELVVSSDSHETKVAVLEDGQLVEVYFQRSNEYSLAGSIHKGRVTRVLPGMQSAFVDLGLERDTFLYVSDFTEESGEDFDRVPERRPPAGGAPRAENGAPVEEVAETVSAAPAAEASTSENGNRDNREGRRFDNDRRGGRRRRRRGGGGRFPESKFADAPAEESSAEAPEEESADTFSEEQEPILLPGESLRKYRGGPPAAAESSEEVAEPVDGSEAEETLETESLEVETVENDSSDEDEIEPRIDFVAAVPEPDAPMHTGAAGRAGEEANGVDEPADSETDSVDAAAAEIAEEVSEEDVPSPEPVDEEPPSDEHIDEPDNGEASRDLPGSDEPVLDEPNPDEGETEEKDSAEAPAQTAEIREQSSRFLQQRSGRRRRRGRGRDDRGDRPEEARSESRPEQQRQPQRREDDRPERQERPQQQLITDLLKEGQEILVQIAKEPLGQKGARITSHIALPGRYCVFMPTVEHTGVSRKIASDEERQRLKRILQTHKKGMAGGFIIRTAGEGKSETELAADMRYLYDLWLDIRQKAEKRRAPAVIYHDLDIVERTLRDQLSDDFKAIWCDSEEKYESLLNFVQRVQPSLVGRVKMYTRSGPIFDAFSVTAELEKALHPKVWLKSGGYIVINQTEALVAIDINTGKFVGKSNRLEDTIVRINTEAVKEIVRQIRLRDLGGIIVIDFIDMDERKNRQKVMQALEEAMRADRAPYKILQFNDFGLVAITRKRVKQSLERTLCQPCPHCEGSGYIKSVSTIVSEILVEARKIASVVDGKEAVLRVNPDVAKVLQSTSNTYLEELEGILKRPVAVVADGLLHHEKFDLS